MRRAAPEEHRRFLQALCTLGPRSGCGSYQL